MHVYLDNAATTKPLEAAIDKANEVHRNYYGNPSSLHALGIDAELEIKRAAKRISAIFGCLEDEIYFNSGGTEGDNTAMFGIAKAKSRRGKHIITTAAEHPAVTMPLKALSEQGYDITTLGVNQNGYIDIDELISSVRSDTIMVSIHHVNSETGTVQDINTAAWAVKDKNPNVIFHTDGVQAFGKLNLDLKGIDVYTASAHKLHAFKGTGVLMIKKGLRISPLIYGGGQQLGLRSGTENVAGIAAFAVAASELEKNKAANKMNIGVLKNRLLDLKDNMPGIFVNGDEVNGSQFILNMSFMGVRGEVLLHALESEGIYVSTGSACNTKRQHKSVLAAYGIGQERIESAIRFSFSPYNTVEEIDYCVASLKKIIPALRR